MKKILFTILFLLTMASATVAENPPGLKAGIQAPDFEATNIKGETIRLSDYLVKGPVVLIFYRGGWCYFCNLQLQAYQAMLDDFEKLGTTIVTVSVDLREKADEMVKGKGFDFEVISNPEADLLVLYNAIYQVPEDLAKMYKEKYSIDLQAASGRDDRIIAVPATYVVDQKGKIVYAHSDRDYKIRKKPEEILQVLRNL